MAKRRILYLFVLLCAYLGQILDVGYIFHFIFYAVLAFPVLGLLISLPAMLGCRAELNVSAPRILRGESASWTLSLYNPFHLPLARASYRIRITNRLTGEVHSARTSIRGAVPEENRRWTLETDHCGMACCQADRLWVCDCLGLFSLPVRRPGQVTLMIAPRPEPPGPFELPEGIGSPIPSLRGKTVLGETYELRPYREGDSLRSVHWKMSAKRDELVTRELLAEKLPLPILTFDHFGSLDAMDCTLDRLAGYSRALLEHERPHAVRWLEPRSGAVRECAVSCQEDWFRCLAAIYSDPVPEYGAAIGSLGSGGDDFVQIHITGTGEPPCSKK